MIERQPAHAGIILVELLGGDRPVDVRHELVLADVDAERRSRAAGGELDVAGHARAERPKFGRGLGKGIEDRHPSGETSRRAFGGGLCELDQFVGRQHAHGLRGGDLLPELENIVRLGAETDRHGHGHGDDAGVLGAEESDAEAGPGVGDQDQPFARLDAGADQAARKGHGLGAEMPVGQGGLEVAAGIEEVEAGLAPGGIVQRLAQAGEAAAAEGQGYVMGRSRHRDPAIRARLQGRNITLHLVGYAIGRHGILKKRRWDSSDRRHRTLPNGSH